ncbi:MAG: Serine/threonine-protein kinase pkn1 [Haliscomenobacter sp.]|jgi:formylglycine-generating enzyme required for sulfatase activity|nr:Serine/threonine-protein kinase pkn1 [Haliscomenobacter sp.]
MQKRTETLPSGPSFNLILVEGGEFRMGSPEGTPDAADDEKPDHLVQVSSFHMGEFPVTQALWEAVMGEQENRSNFRGPNRPIERVSWYDAVAFCNRLSRELGLPFCYYSDERFKKAYSLEGPLSNEGPVFFNAKVGGFRLPTESEWEYAARGGKYSEGYRYAGSDRLKQVGWYDENSGKETHEVGLLYPNELGLYDMSGNVWEWCEDQWHGNYQGAPKDGSAWVDQKQGAARVRRGGGWYYYAQNCRSAYRTYSGPEYRDDDYGFRLVLSLQSAG